MVPTNESIETTKSTQLPQTQEQEYTRNNPPTSLENLAPNPSIMSGSDTNTDNTRFLMPPFVRALGIMPRPGQPGLPFFEDTNVTKFLRCWNIECEDFGLSVAQKCA